MMCGKIPISYKICTIAVNASENVAYLVTIVKWMNATKHVFTVQCIFQIVDYGTTIIRMATEYPHFHPKFNASKKHAWRRRAKERCREEVKCCLFNMQIEPIQFNRDESIYIWSFAHVSFSSYYRNLYNNTYYKYTRMSAVCIVQVYCISFVVCFPCKYAVCLVLLTF